MNINNIKKKLLSPKWTIGFINAPLSDIVNGTSKTISWVKNNYKDRWFADPFITKVTSEYIYLLCEEYYYPINRGRISRLVIDRKTFSILSVFPLIELDSHLSFPAFYGENDNIYIYPENSAAGKLSLYKVDSNKKEVTYIRDLINEPLTDAIYTDLFGEPLLFSTELPYQNGNILGVYKQAGQQFAHYKDIIFDSNVARNGGQFFELDDKIYRCAQDCNQSYGKAVIIQEVLYENEKFSFRDVRRIESTNRKYNLACHTFNYCNGYAVLDARGNQFPLIFSLALFLHKVAKAFRVNN